ncbi:2-C-methyl-D-erythritol 4-phosphate cytidylyltransferase [Nocardioides sp. CFH 31398]|uniref:2-C-methyl-D-erythritol 4-phosphate cytidylyltransferase n=1 Tax=Nocardioides sp. CFH 31398 TaxID=2919579 RepID=UPI001F061204|nr:2-C-methyl-D-erythritol 4-phosphate cytidylyltransferase [Nocardioides sp. CFH 31398]MCH1865934.1 2-C-methyl-D-erythritol 4-phosphate cytidylyltransferase [Nocardioides sp. CFH 31398]
MSPGPIGGWDDEPDATGPAGSDPALGVVLDEGRGTLPYAVVHGTALVACAAEALAAAGVDAVDAGTPWARVRATGADVVLHDALCPLTPPAFLVGCLEAAREQDAAVVAVRPVTDTVRTLAPGDPPRLGELVDRDGLVAVASPVVLPASVVASYDGWPPTDPVELVASLRQRGTPVLLEAPAVGRRVTGEDDLRVLEAVSEAVAEAASDQA